MDELCKYDKTSLFFKEIPYLNQGFLVKIYSQWINSDFFYSVFAMIPYLGVATIHSLTLNQV